MFMYTHAQTRVYTQIEAINFISRLNNLIVRRIYAQKGDRRLINN